MVATAVLNARSFIKVRQSAIFPVLDVLLNLFNWGFHVLVCWFLVPEAYGRLNSLLALLSVLMVLGVALQLLTAQHTASHGLDDLGAIQQLSVLVAGFITLIGLIGMPFLIWLTRTNPLCILLVLGIFDLNSVLAVRRGAQQGQATFLCLNGSFYLEVVVKLAATAILLSLWPMPEAAILAVGIGMGAALWATAGGIRESHAGHVKASLLPWMKRLMPVLFASFFLYFFSAIDMLIVNRLLPDQAGIYAVAIKYGQILFFAALSISTVFVPRMSRAHHNGEPILDLALQLVGILATACLCGILAGRTFLPYTVGPVFGSGYAAAGALVAPAMLAYGLLALCFALVNILVVVQQRSYLAALFAAACAVVTLLVLHHGTPLTVLQVLAGVYGALFVVLSLLTLPSLKGVSHVTEA